MATKSEVIFFHYPLSPWSRKVIHYLAFRGLNYSECVQPIMLPRPDIADLGVKYRRIPVMSVGKDMYCDTVIMLEKLETLFPDNALGAKKPKDRALERMLEKWTDFCVFRSVAEIIPSNLPLIQDEKFQKDREDLWGHSWKPEDRDKLMPAAMVNMQTFFVFLEDMMEDGRDWVLGTESPSLADIHGVWSFIWLAEIPGAYSPHVISASKYPKTFAWMDRYNKAVDAAKAKAPKPKELSGAEAVQKILSGDFGEPEGPVDSDDPLALKKGEEVAVFPADTGTTYRQKGKLVSLTPQESVVASKTPNGTDVRVHFPRWNFQVEAA